MDAQAWAWALLLGAQAVWIVAAVRLGRARDPRDADGRKVPLDEQALRRAERQHAWGVGIWGACTLASFALRVVDDPDLLAPSSIWLGLLAIAVAVTTLFHRRRRPRADAAARSSATAPTHEA